MPHCITAHHCTMLCPIYPISHNITTEQTIRSSQIWASQRGRSTLATSLGMTSRGAHWSHWVITLKALNYRVSPHSRVNRSTVPLLRITHKPSQKVVYYIILQCTTINIHKPLLSCSCLMIFWCFLQFCRQETYFTLPFSKATLMQPAGMV